LSAKPETSFYTSVHRHLPPLSELHREKMNNPYRGGTFDHWYSGVRDLWVEWKFIKLPVRDTTAISLCGGAQPALSAIQQNWGACRHAEGRTVWVVAGCKEGGVIMRTPSEWQYAWPTVEFRRALLNRQAIAAAILAASKGAA
jgi:hypothetical protein